MALWKAISAGDLEELSRISFSDEEIQNILISKQRGRAGPFPLEAVILNAYRSLKRNNSEEAVSVWTLFLSSFYEKSTQELNKFTEEQLEQWNTAEQAAWEQCARYIQNLFPLFKVMIEQYKSRELKNANIGYSLQYLAQSVFPEAIELFFEHCKPIDQIHIDAALYKVILFV